MKSIENCLDETLRVLNRNYDESGRPPLIYPELHNYYDTKLRRPEFFTGIIDKLVSDGYVTYFDELKKAFINEEDRQHEYSHKAIITPSGIDFIVNKGGYNRKLFIERILRYLPIVISIAALIFSALTWYNNSKKGDEQKSILKQHEQTEKTIEKINQSLLYSDLESPLSASTLAIY